MSDKPTYLGLLNAIALGEAQAECYLSAWADVTPSDEVAHVLRSVAVREGEHGKTFAKRIWELGYSVLPRDDEGAAKRMDIASSTTLTDREKFEKLGLGRRPSDDGDDVFTSMFKDRTIDVATGELLGRYIAEERDSGRLLRACYELLCAAEAPSNGQASDEAIASIEKRLDRIESSLKKMAARK